MSVKERKFWQERRTVSDWMKVVDIEMNNKFQYERYRPLLN